MDWLLLEGTPTGGGGGPTPIPPTIAFDSASIRVTEGTPIINVVRWTDTDTTVANPIASVVQTLGPGSLGSLSNLALTSGQATWSHTATLADNGTTISVTITDGDGLTDTAVFTLEVDQVPSTGDGTTECGPFTLPTSVTASLSTFANGLLDIPPGGTIQPDLAEALNGQEIIFNVPTEDDLPVNADCTYGRIEFLSIPANPASTNSGTINIAFELSWAQSHPTNSNQETWMLATNIFIDDDGSENAQDDFTRTVLFTGPAIGFEDWPTVPVEYPPQYPGETAVPPWAGVLNLTDSANTSEDAPVSTLTIDTSPANPSIVRLTTNTTTSDATDLTHEYLAVTVAGGGATIPTESTTGFPPVIDMTSFEGQQATVSYWGKDSAGQLSEVVSAVVTVPPFGNRYTVPGTHTSIQDAVNAMNPGDEVTVQPGTYPRFSIPNGQDYTVRAATAGTATIEGTSGVNTTISLGTISNCRIEGFRLANVQKYGMYLDFNRNDCVVDSISFVNGSDPAIGTTYCMYNPGGSRNIYLNCHIEGILHPVGVGLGGGAGTAYAAQLQNGTGHDITYWNCTAADGAKDGFAFFNKQGGVKMHWCKTYGNYRQGLITGDADSVVVEDCLFGEDPTGTIPGTSGNQASGIQMEADANNLTLYTKHTEIRRCTLAANASWIEFGGEKNGWIDDAEDFLVEDCTIFNSGATGLQADSDPGKLTKRGIFRFNTIIESGLTTQPGDRLGIAVKGVQQFAAYHNTIRKVGTGLANFPTAGIGVSHRNLGTLDDSDITLKNNVVDEVDLNQTGESYSFPARQIIIKDKAAIKDMDGNIYSKPPSTDKGYQIGWVKTAATNFTGWQSNMSPHESNSQEVPDIMVDSNHRPTTGSPLIGAAVPMATTTGATAGFKVPLSSTDWVWISLDPEKNDTLLFPNGRAKVVSKTATHVTLEALPPGGIASGSEVRLWRKTGTADVGAIQS